MKMIMMMVVGLVMAMAANGQEYFSGANSGATQAVVSLPAKAGGIRVVAVDITSDKAGSLATLRYGRTSTTIAKAALGTETNVLTYTSTLASNDTVLVQKEDGTMQKLTVFGRTPTTNLVAALDGVLGTNLAAGDTFATVLPTGYTVLAASASSNFVVSQVAGLASNDAIVTHTPAWKGLVFGVSTNSYARLTVRGGVREGVGIGDVAYKVTTNAVVLVSEATATATNWNVGSTNGFTNGNKVLLETAAGDMKVMTLSTVSTTNMTVVTAAGFAMATNDRVWLLATNYTVRLPAERGDAEVVLDCSTNWSTNEVIAFVPTSRPTWIGISAGATVATNVYGLTLKESLTNGLLPGVVFQKATNTFRLALPAAATAAEVTITNLTGLAAGDEVVISPASGGTFFNRFRLGTAVVMNTVNFSSTNTIAFAAGDQVYSTATQTMAIGNTTVRQSGEAIWFVPPWRPAQVTVDGTAAVSINNITWR